MAGRETKYVDRVISENEDALLDELWESIPAMPDTGVDVGESYRALEARMEAPRRRNVGRIRIYAAAAAGAAAVLLAAVLVPGNVFRKQLPADIEEMVAFADNHVELIVDGSYVAQLENSAAVVVGEASSVSLRTPEGPAIDLGHGQTVKIKVPAGRRFDLALADGTHVWLNGGTMLEYPSTFEGAATRTVRMSGEALFDVRPDAAKPFMVDIGAGESIRVLGTTFNVSAYPEDAESVTTLVSGSIEYSGAGGRSVVLRPDQQLKAVREDGTLITTDVNGADFTAWKDGIIYMDGDRLPAIARKLSRLYGIEVVVSEEYAQMRFSGTVVESRGLNHIIKLLTDTSDIECRVDNGIIYLE